jgi:hypothetical protein
LISNFISETLPRLVGRNNDHEENNEAFRSNHRCFVFTHYDLSHRNTLILFPSKDSGDDVNGVPHITGLVDFEFAGFFPPVDEFVNDYVDNGGDWPTAVYSAYLDRLEELRVPTPQKGLDEEVWKRAHRLGRLLDSVAPWWLPGNFEKDELDLKLAECREIVRSSILELS